MFKKLRFRNIKIGWKYGLIFIVMFIFLAAATASVAILINNIEKNLHATTQNGNRAIEVTELGSLSRSKSIRISDYLLKSDQSYIDEYELRRQEFNELKDKLQKQMVSEEQQALFEKIVENDSLMNSLFLDTIVSETQLNDTDAQFIEFFHNRTNELREETISLIEELRASVIEYRSVVITESEKSAAVARSVLLIAMIVSIAVGGILLLFVSRLITRHLQKVVELSNHIAEGDLSTETIHYKGTDEIGLLISSVNAMKENLSNVLRQVAGVAETVSNQSEELTHSASEVSAGTEQASATMLQLASGAEAQAGHTTELAAAMGTFSSKVQESNANGEMIETSSHDVLNMANEGSKLMQSSIKQMEKIDDLVQGAVQNVQGLDSQSREISKLVLVIKDIAEQTNLLALNAAIEAARAGEQGRGFAVVADEVRKLAEQVAFSVSDITRIVSSIQKESTQVVESLQGGYKEVEHGTSQIQTTGETFKKINEAITNMVSGVHVVSNNLSTIASQSQEMNVAIEEISSITQQSAAGIEETSASVEQTNSSMVEVADSADHLSILAEELNGLVRQFKL